MLKNTDNKLKSLSFHTKSELKINNDELSFIVFCIENVADKLSIEGHEVYQLLTVRSNILFDYILPNYDILHTQSKEYIVSDIIDYMHEKEII